MESRSTNCEKRTVLNTLKVGRRSCPDLTSGTVEQLCYIAELFKGWFLVVRFARIDITFFQYDIGFCFSGAN